MTPDQILSSWKEKEISVREHLRAPGVAPRSQVFGIGRQVATAEGRIVGSDGKLYAHATTTCLIFDH